MPADGPLSYSSVRTYLECPQRWKYLYIDKIPEAPRGYFSFGRSVHAVLEELLRPLVVPGVRKTGGDRQHTLDDWPGHAAGRTSPPGHLMTPEELLACYAKEWVGDGYTSAEEEKRYRSLGAQLILDYRATLEEAPPAPVAVEEHLEATWDGIAVHGYLDRIDRTPAGTLEIIDYKTSRELSSEDARSSEQLTMYQYLVEQNYAEPVERLTLYHLRGRTPLSTPRREAGDLDAFHQKVGVAHDGIRSESYEPTPGRPCARCEFRSICPEFRHVPEPEQKQLAELVDRFQRLRSEETRLEENLRAAANALHREAERLGVHRIPGSASVAIRRRDEVWRYREDSVAPLLAEHGLSDKVRADDGAALRRLTQDARLDAGLRKRLSAAGSRQVRWYWDLEDAAAGS